MDKVMMTRKPEIEQITDEAIQIARYVSEMRSRRPPKPSTDRFKTFTLFEMANMEIPPKGLPSKDADCASAYKAALHFWAAQVAPRITFKQWEDIVERAYYEVPDFNGDVIRFFETLFEGRRLRDGNRVYP
jgi:hypothetical protein